MADREALSRTIADAVSRAVNDAIHSIPIQSIQAVNQVSGKNEKMRKLFGISHANQVLILFCSRL